METYNQQATPIFINLLVLFLASTVSALVVRGKSYRVIQNWFFEKSEIENRIEGKNKNLSELEFRSGSKNIYMQPGEVENNSQPNPERPLIIDIVLVFFTVLTIFLILNKLRFI